MLSQAVFAFFACIFFAIVFHSPKKELPWCGLTGAIGWFLYCIINYNNAYPVFAIFAATLAVTATSRFLSHIRRAPSTVFLIPGILPFVPGAGIYYTMRGILNGDMVYSYTQGIQTLKLAGAIAIGIILILSLPYSVFNFIKLKEK